MEAKLENDINYYTDQLKNIEIMLMHCDNHKNDDSHKDELIQLQNDIKSLLNIAQEKLLSIKKERLLELTKPPTIYIKDSDDASSISSGENELNDPNEPPQLVLAPYDKGFGPPEYHTAIAIDEQQNNTTIIYTHPCFNDMVVCEKFMENNCDNYNCRNSHGFTVSTHLLKELPLDYFSTIDRNKQCLIKMPSDNNSLWLKGRINNIFDEIIEVTLNDKSINEPVLLEKEFIWFFKDVANDTESIIEDTPDSLYESKIEHSSLDNHIDNNPFVNSFAHKMMQKMGYIPGKGLGKTLQGTVEPVHIYKAPKGTSLDTFMKMKACGNLKNLPTLLNKKTMGKSSNVKKNKILNVINNTSNAGKSTNHHNYNAPLFKHRLDRNSKNFNLQAFQIGEDIKNQANEINMLKLSIQQNNQDQRYTDKLRRKLNSAKIGLDKMLLEERQIKAQLDKSILKKKMASFK